MNAKKMFLLRDGKIVSVTKILSAPVDLLTTAELHVLVKEPREESFHAPIEKAHPKYWKLKTLDAARQRVLQLRYSGLNKKEIDIALSDLKSK